MSDINGAFLFGAEAFADGYAAEEEAVATVPQTNVFAVSGGAAIRGGMSDLDGDGVDDLLLEGWEIAGVAVFVPALFSGSDLDSVGLDLSAAEATLPLPEGALSVASGAVADLDGDGNSDLALSVHTEEEGEWRAEAAVFLGPLRGEVDSVGIVRYVDGSAGWPGVTVSLGDLDEDGRDEVGVGSSRDHTATFAVYAGATLAGGGAIDAVTGRWAYREETLSWSVADDVYTGDLDDDGTIDLSLRVRAPVNPAGPESPIWGAEIYLDMAGR